MCPMCMTTLALIASVAISVGGLAAQLVKNFHAGGPPEFNASTTHCHGEPR
jgi:hypothetical protein